MKSVVINGLPGTNMSAPEIIDPKRTKKGTATFKLKVPLGNPNFINPLKIRKSSGLPSFPKPK